MIWLVLLALFIVGNGAVLLTIYNEFFEDEPDFD